MPRAGVTTDRVVEEAELLADEVGLADVTLAQIAGRLEVKVPSLYKHVNGLDALHGQISARAVSELGDVMARAAVGLARADAVDALARAYRDWAQRHPGRYSATLRAPDPDDQAAPPIPAGRTSLRVIN